MIQVDNFPFIDEVEISLFSASLQERKFWVTFYPHIVPEYFKNKELSKIFKIWKVYFDKHKEFPTIEQTKNFNFKKQFGINDNLINSVYTKKIEQHELNQIHDDIHKFIKEQKVKFAIMQSVDFLSENKYDDIETEIKKAISWNASINLGTQLSHAEDRYAAVDELMAGVLPTPWSRLNYYLGGGFFQKELAVFASSSSVGKSIALDQCAVDAWKNQGKNVVVISFELNEIRKGMRMDACGIGIPISEVIAQKNKIFKYYKENKLENKLYIKEFPTMAVNSQAIEQYLYHLELYEGLHKPDVLVVDYGDIMLPKGKVTHNPYLDQGHALENLRALGQIYDFPVLSASQFAKTVIDLPVDEVHEGNLADSFKKMHIADTLIALVSTPDDRKHQRLFMKLLKNRSGEKDVVIPFTINYPEMRIENFKSKIDEEEDEQ